MTRFALIRHGHKAPGSGDVPLSALGRRQAAATAHLLASWPIRAVYASPLRRAAQTARIIARRHALPVRVDARLRERANWGDLPGQSFADFVAMWDRGTAEPDYIPPVGDSARAARDRLDAFLRDVIASPAPSSPEDIVVAVTHGGLITDFLGLSLPTDLLERWQPEFKARQSELVPECSTTLLHSVGSDYRVDAFAATAHLAAGIRNRRR